MTQPNIILIFMDDLGYGNLGCYNPDSDIATPNIDRLPRDGVRFTQFYAPSNICSPSRRALLTGRYQSRLGEWAEAYRGTPPRDAVSGRDEPCFAQYLQKVGYANGSFGKWNVGEVNGVSTPDAQGFDYWIGSHHNTSYFGHCKGGELDFWENGKPAPQFCGQFADDVFVDKAIGFIRASVVRGQESGGRSQGSGGSDRCSEDGAPPCRAGMVERNNVKRDLPATDSPQTQDIRPKSRSHVGRGEHARPLGLSSTLYASVATEGMCKNSEKLQSRNSFFVYLSLFTPHAPFQDPSDPVEEGRPDLAPYNVKGGPPPPAPSQADRPTVRKMIEHVDRRIGDVLQTIRELGQEENTLVIFTSDNGGMRAANNFPLAGFKQQMLEGGLRVPAIIKWPGVIPAGITSSQVGIHMDWAETIIQAAGAGDCKDPSRPLDGIDLVPMLSGQVTEAPRELGMRRREWNDGDLAFNDVWSEAYIKGDWKYIREFKEAADYGLSLKGVYPETGYLELLFNLKDDIHEDNDVSKQESEKLSEMCAAFDVWKASTVDPDKHYAIPVPDQYVRQLDCTGKQE